MNSFISTCQYYNKDILNQMGKQHDKSYVKGLMANCKYKDFLSQTVDIEVDHKHIITILRLVATKWWYFMIDFDVILLRSILSTILIWITLPTIILGFYYQKHYIDVFRNVFRIFLYLSQNIHFTFLIGETVYWCFILSSL
jgi:hypothetical protein